MQVEQAFAAGPILLAAYVVEGQVVHELSPLNDQAPSAQSKQELEPGPENLPASHGEEIPATQKYPGEHFEQND